MFLSPPEQFIQPDYFQFVWLGSEVRLFSAWASSYMAGDSWRLSTRIVHVAEEAGTIKLTTGSGSTYVLQREAHGRMSGYGSTILQQFVNGAGGQLLVVEQALARITGNIPHPPVPPTPPSIQLDCTCFSSDCKHTSDPRHVRHRK